MSALFSGDSNVTCLAKKEAEKPRRPEKVKREDVKAARRLQRDVQKHRCGRRKHRKDSVLHLRIEGDVMDRIKAEAAVREESVSDLIRSCLNERFPETRTSGALPDFLHTTAAFSDVVIMRDTRCVVCDQALPHGTHAMLAYGPPPPERLVCATCYAELQSQPEKQHKPSGGEE